MSPADERFIRNWSNARKMGRARYALTRGVIFGLLFFLFTGLYGLWEQSFADVFLTTRSIVVFLFWITAGIGGYAALAWPVNEYLFKKKQREAEL